MHDLIFEKFGNQKKDDLRRYAGGLGLDLARFDADFAAAEPRVKADMKDGADVEVDGHAGAVPERPVVRWPGRSQVPGRGDRRGDRGQGRGGRAGGPDARGPGAGGSGRPGPGGRCDKVTFTRGFPR
jgi:hypothetical protein